MGIVARDRAGESKRQQQTEKSEDCAFDGPALSRGLVKNAEAAAYLEHKEHGR